MIAKKDISNREDVKELVVCFYKKIRAHDTLGTIFNKVIKDWDTHFEHLTDFWEAQLFLKRKYRGNPLTVHQNVDKVVNYTITSEHFGQWLNLWFETIDALYEGETARIAKNRAQKMSTMLFMKIFEARN